jgi:putative transposase
MVAAKAKVARAHRKVRASWTDFLHATSTRLVRDHDVIVIEDLAVKDMVRNTSLATSVSDSGWGTFRQMLTDEAEKYGRTVVVIDRWYPSRKTCSNCGHLLATLSLGDTSLDVSRTAAGTSAWPWRSPTPTRLP